MARLFASLILLSLATACGQGDNSGQNSGASGRNPAIAKATEAAPASPSAPAAVARKVSVSNDLIEYDYAYPAVAAAIPAQGLSYVLPGPTESVAA